MKQNDTEFSDSKIKSLQEKCARSPAWALAGQLCSNLGSMARKRGKSALIMGLRFINVPMSEDVERLHKKLSELESSLKAVQNELTQLERSSRRS